MIEISSTLQAAAEAESRSPIFGVDVIQKRLDFKGLRVSPMYKTHRLAAGDGYWIATGYGTGSPPTTIYYQRFTTLLDISDWSSGWSSLVTNVEDARVHDLFIDGDNVTVAYWDDFLGGNPSIYGIKSSDGGQTWGSPYSIDFPTHPQSDYVYSISIINTDTYYWIAGTYGTELHLIRTYDPNGKTRSYFTDDFSDETFEFMTSSADIVQRQLHARLAIDNYTEAVVFNSFKGLNEDDRWRGVFTLFSHNGETVAHVYRALGCLETDLDYTFELRGLSREKLGNYYIGAMLETYNKTADVDGATSENALFICRTKDLRSFELIPTNIGASPEEPLDSCYIAGFVEDGNGNTVTVVTYQDGAAADSYIRYSESTWLTGYETGQAIESDVINPIKIDRSVRSVARAEITLANKGDNYTVDDVVTEGSVARISAGYKTTSGDELQRRFTGQIVSVGRTPTPDETIDLVVYDMLHLAARRADRPHVLGGQNFFRADFSVAGDDKKMVHQAGVWGMSGSLLTQTETGVNAFSLCGYDPDDSFTITAKLRANTSITDVKMGVVLGYSPDEIYDRIYTVVCYNETTNDFEYGYIDVNGNYNLIDILTSTLGWNADQDYYIRVDRHHNQVRFAYYGSSYGTWFGGDVDLATQTGAKEYPGLFCYVPSGGAGVSFSQVSVAAQKKPLTGSDVMEYLATMCGMDTDEQELIRDEFSGSALSSDWVEGPNGSWSVSSGAAHGVGTAANPAEACVDGFLASDVVVGAYIVPVTGHAQGLSLRSDCNSNRYSLLVTATGYEIEKEIDGVITTLDYIATGYSVGTSTTRIDFSARGPWLSAFINGQLVGYAYDTDLESGYVGMISACDTPEESEHEEFFVGGFYRPIGGTVVIKQKDTPISIMDQIADLVPDGQFFCNENGALRWGVFPETASADLDIEDVVLNRAVRRGLDKLLTSASVVGNLAYANAREDSWAIRLSGHLWDSVDDKLIESGQEAHTLAVDKIRQTHRILETSVGIRANPGLELCDIVTVQADVVRLLDTFTDVASTDLTDHDPDTDVEGSGWERNAFYGGYITISSDNTAEGSAAAQWYQIDIGVVDFVVEVDLQTASDEVNLIFRKSPGSNQYKYIQIDPVDNVIVLGEYLGTGSAYPVDIITGPGVGANEWYHVKVKLSGDNIVATVTVRGVDHVLTFYGADVVSTQTEIGLILKGSGSEADNLTAYVPGSSGQVLSMGEEVGATYEMTIQDLLGGEEYW